MTLASTLVFSLLAAARLSAADQVGYFEDSSIVADPEGLVKCYDDAQDYYTTCINKNCSGGDEECSKACNGDVSCMEQQCPNLGIDCMNACGCVQATDNVACIAAHGWNQVYSCEYQRTVEDLFTLCAKPDADNVPFWPPPDDAPGRCSCNMGRIDKNEIEIQNQISACANNETLLNQISSADDVSELGNACICCYDSAMLSTIYNTCPNTRPDNLAFDTYYAQVSNDWLECGDYLDQYDCAGDLGFGASTAGDTHTFYKPGNFPKNGTQTLYNTAGALTTPVSATFTWTWAKVERTIVAESTDNVVKATASRGGGSDGPTATETGASATQTDGASVGYISLCRTAFVAVSLGLAFL